MLDGEEEITEEEYVGQEDEQGEGHGVEDDEDDDGGTPMREEEEDEEDGEEGQDDGADGVRTPAPGTPAHGNGNPPSSATTGSGVSQQVRATVMIGGGC